MSTSDLTLTLVGWVGTEPRHYTGAAVTPFTSFRMANTRRWFDRAQNGWTDGRTEWFTVKVWRQSALNVAASLRKGDPVLVHGRLSTEQWESPEGPRTSLVLEALAIGPDLTYGRAAFARTVHVGGAAGPGGAGEPTGAAEDVEPASGGGLDDDPWAADLVDPADERAGGRRGPGPGVGVAGGEERGAEEVGTEDVDGEGVGADPTLDRVG